MRKTVKKEETTVKFISDQAEGANEKTRNPLLSQRNTRRSLSDEPTKLVSHSQKHKLSKIPSLDFPQHFLRKRKSGNMRKTSFEIRVTTRKE